MGLSPEELESSGVIQFPVVVGAVVTVVNLPGVGPGDLVLDAETLGPPSPDRPMVVAMAVFVEKPRLIDNIVLGERPAES